MFNIKKRTNKLSENEELAKVMTASFAMFEYCDFGWMAFEDYHPNDILLMCGDDIVGFHLFIEYSIINYTVGTDIIWKENMDKYKNKKGLNGFIMGVLPKYTKKGGATKMIEYEKKNYSKDYDYIWGGAYKAFNNIEFWEKSRRLVGESSGKIGRA